MNNLLNDPKYADMSIQDLIDEGVVEPKDVWQNMAGEVILMDIDQLETALNNDVGDEFDDWFDSLDEDQLALFNSDIEGTS